MSTTEKTLHDIVQMASDTGLREDQIRGLLESWRVPFGTNIGVTTAREARNAFRNLQWFMAGHRTGHSATEGHTMIQNALSLWRKLSLDELRAATTREQALEVYKGSPQDLKEDEVALNLLVKFYKFP